MSLIRDQHNFCWRDYSNGVISVYSKKMTKKSKPKFCFKIIKHTIFWTSAKFVDLSNQEAEFYFYG